LRQQTGGYILADLLVKAGNGFARDIGTIDELPLVEPLSVLQHGIYIGQDYFAAVFVLVVIVLAFDDREQLPNRFFFAGREVQRLV
jgi:hypothetical protein